MGSSIFKSQNNNQLGVIADRAKAMMNDSRQMQNVMSMLSGKGMSAEQMVRSICRERGIDVNEFMNSIK